MSKDINKISVDDLYKLMEEKEVTQEDIDAFAERVRLREEEFKKGPGAHHPIDLDYRYGPCD